MTYTELKQKHQNEVNAFPFGFAFGNGQFAEMMKEWGFDENNKDDLRKIVSIGAGGFVQKKDVPDMEKMFERHKQELKEFRKNRTEIKQAILHEMFNIEYGYSNDDEHLLNNLDIDVDAFVKDKELQKIFKEAEKEYYKTVRL